MKECHNKYHKVFDKQYLHNNETAAGVVDEEDMPDRSLGFGGPRARETGATTSTLEDEDDQTREASRQGQYRVQLADAVAANTAAERSRQ